MKIILKPLVLTIFLLLSVQFLVFSQTETPLYGKDIIIHPDPSQDQTVSSVCSAFNGWLYCVYGYFNSNTDFARLVFNRSTDGGITWTVLDDHIWVANGMPFKKIKIVSTGNSVESLKLFVATTTIIQGQTTNVANCVINRFDKDCQFEEGLLDLAGFDLDITTDFFDPDISTFSLGVILTEFPYPSCMVNYFLSTDGGQSLQRKARLEFSDSLKFQKASIAYGKVPGTGKKGYFLVWEESDEWGTHPSRIFTSHTTNGIDTPMSPPMRIDNLIPGGDNMCNNPVISCQYNVDANDSSDATSVIIFQKKKLQSGTYDLVGLYNPHSFTSSDYTPISIVDSINNNIQPDICFNYFDSSFYLTYYDSSEQKLPLLRAPFNISPQTNWETITTGYNDSTDLSDPQPKIALNYLKEQVINCWSAGNENDKGVILFDSQYSVYTGVDEKSKYSEIEIFPNPCRNKIEVQIRNSEAKKVEIYNAYGVLKYTENICGKNTIELNLTQLPSGTYILRLSNDKSTLTGKFIKIL